MLLYLTLSLTILGCDSRQPLEWSLPVPAELIALNSTKGILLLSDPSTRAFSFWQGFQHLVTQETQTFCSIASSVTILNAIASDIAPVDPTYNPYPYWTQDNFFNECTNNVVDRSIILQIGSTLDQVASMLQCFNISAQAIKANETNVDGFRNDLTSALSIGNHIASNFYRNALGEPGGGHFSPLMAFNPSYDMVLMTGICNFVVQAFRKAFYSFSPRRREVQISSRVDPSSRIV
jgi:hypothetical protein